MKIGINSIAFDVSKIHLPIKTLAEKRNIEAEKLEKGLGLLKMTIPDVHQDAVVFGANALTKLIVDNHIDLETIDRIYVGSESGVDNSKPLASYLLALMEQKFGDNKLEHCDVVDFTFACIGGVDALQNCVDFIKIHPTKKAVIVTTDFAKYDLNSTGEYTQGAGAVAMLVCSNPNLLAFKDNWATSTKGVFDFFKPYHTIKKSDISGNDFNECWNGILESEIEVHKHQPVFDGQYSNQCYVDRTKNAYYRLKTLNDEKSSLYNSWSNIIMHLPYAFQGRRMLSEIFALDASENQLLVDDIDYYNKVKEISKSAAYKNFVTHKLMPAELASSLIGNLYTGSIFMGLLSTLSHYFDQKTKIENNIFGFMAYGSGSKSKVFEAVVQQNWKLAMPQIQLFETLATSTEISFETYEKLHKKELKTSVKTPKNEWILDYIENENPVLKGARFYKWID